MSTLIKAIVFFVALVVWLPAQAQLLGLGFESNIELTKHDLDVIHNTVDQQVHGETVGTSASWSNPDSGNYGTIELTRKFTQNGRPCETVRYTLATKRMAVAPEHYTLNSCLLPDGKWRII
jgi:surface antigen